MVRVTVKLLGVLHEATGWFKREIDVEGDRVRDLLEKLWRDYPRLREYMEDPEEDATILVNGRDIEFLDGLDTRLKDGDTVAIIPPAGGG